MKTRTRLVQDVQDFINRHDITPESLGWQAVRNSAVVKNLLRGGDVTTKTMDKLYEFMDLFNVSQK